MATVSNLLRVNTAALQFAAAKIRATPSDVINWAEHSIITKMREIAENSGIQGGLLDSLTGDTQRVIDEQIASWANATDVERKYNFSSDDPEIGWLALCWGINDQIASDAGAVSLAWK